jgi:hypothetical protein
MQSPSISQPRPKKQPFNIDANQTSTNQQAVPNVWFAGRRRVPFHWIAPDYNRRFEKVTGQTGKDQEGTVAQVLHSDLAATFGCAGRYAPFFGIYRLIQNSVIVWEGAINRDADPFEPVTVDGFGPFYVYWGTATQPRDAYVLTPIADTVPPGVDHTRLDYLARRRRNAEASLSYGIGPRSLGQSSGLPLRRYNRRR